MGAIRQYIYRYMVSFFMLRELKECGEFKDVCRVVSVGGKIYAVMLKYLYRNDDIQCRYCTFEDFDKLYRFKKDTKWIIFDESILQKKKKIETLREMKNVIVSPLAYRG